MDMAVCSAQQMKRGGQLQIPQVEYIVPQILSFASGHLFNSQECFLPRVVEAIYDNHRIPFQ